MLEIVEKETFTFIRCGVFYKIHERDCAHEQIRLNFFVNRNSMRTLCDARRTDGSVGGSRKAPESARCETEQPGSEAWPHRACRFVKGSAALLLQDRERWMPRRDMMP